MNRKTVNMGVKICVKCNKKKIFHDFSKDKYKTDGLCTVCKDCRQIYRAGYYAKNSEKAKSDSLRWYYQNREEVIEKNKIRYRSNIEKNKKRRKEQYWKDPISAKIAVRNYNGTRAATDPVYRMACRCRKRIWAALKEGGYTKKSRSFDIIGCTVSELVAHLESQFRDGMSWDNYGKWHIDHIFPLASADTEEKVISLCHYTNLQPLWASENLSKSARLDYRSNPSSS